MPSDTELSRLADMAHALRPDWHPRSVRAFLATSVRTRAYRDVAVALAAIACDSTTTTPGRLDESGPWWAAAVAAGGTSTPLPGPGSSRRCDRPGHEHEPASTCRACRAELVAVDGPPEPVEGRTPEAECDCGRLTRFLVDGRCFECRAAARGEHLRARTARPTRALALAIDSARALAEIDPASLDDLIDDASDRRDPDTERILRALRDALPALRGTPTPDLEETPR